VGQLLIHLVHVNTARRVRGLLLLKFTVGVKVVCIGLQSLTICMELSSHAS